MKIAQQKDILFTGRVVPKFVTKCALRGKSNNMDLASDGSIEKVVEKFECMTSGIKESLNGTEHMALSAKYEKLFLKSIENVRKCDEYDDLLDEAL